MINTNLEYETDSTDDEYESYRSLVTEFNKSKNIIKKHSEWNNGTDNICEYNAAKKCANTDQENEILSKDSQNVNNNIFDYDISIDDVFEKYGISSKNTSTKNDDCNSTITEFDWNTYLNSIKAIAAPCSLFDKPFDRTMNGFKNGMMLEVINPFYPSEFRVATVVATKGTRLCLHMISYPSSRDFWINSDAWFIFPAGYCKKKNRLLNEPSYYKENFDWLDYLHKNKGILAMRHLFGNRSRENILSKFEKGMKLEVINRSNTRSVFVGTIKDIIDHRFLVHIDEEDFKYDFWATADSPYIRYVDWHLTEDFDLIPPNSYINSPETFSWINYLKDTQSKAVPRYLFRDIKQTEFKTGMRLECVDPRVPQLIRCATVSLVKKNSLKIHFDGWQSIYDFWIDKDSTELHPVGWCSKTNHPLEPPLTEDFYNEDSCGTHGCKGIGRLNIYGLSTHEFRKDCPYALQNITAQVFFNNHVQFKKSNSLEDYKSPFKFDRSLIMKPNVKLEKIESLVITLTDDESSSSSSSSIPSSVPLVNQESNNTNHSLVSSSTTNNQILGKRKSFESKLQTSMNKKILKINEPLDPIEESTIEDKEILIIEKWTPKDVAHYIETLPGCQNLGKLFIEHQIDGEALLMVTQSDFTNVMKMKLGPAIKLFNRISMLKKSLI